MPQEVPRVRVPLRLFLQPEEKCRALPQCTDGDGQARLKPCGPSGQQFEGGADIRQVETKVTGSSVMALVGISGYSASRGSCTIVKPPAS